MVDVFVDTNVLIYQWDKQAGRKTDRADVLVANLRVSKRGALSSQVLSEFSAVATKKIADPLTPSTAATAVEDYASLFRVVTIEPHVVVEALRGVSTFGFHFYDAQVWAAARLSGCRLVLSEDFTDGSVADGVRFANPFADGFDPATLERPGT